MTLINCLHFILSKEQLQELLVARRTIIGESFRSLLHVKHYASYIYIIYLCLIEIINMNSKLTTLAQGVIQGKIKVGNRVWAP